MYVSEQTAVLFEAILFSRNAGGNNFKENQCYI
jgi:hypothetical protein